MNRRTVVAAGLASMILRPETGYAQTVCQEVVSWFAQSTSEGLYDDRQATIERSVETIAKLKALPRNAYVDRHLLLYQRLLAYARATPNWGRKNALAFVRRERKRCH